MPEPIPGRDLWKMADRNCSYGKPPDDDDGGDRADEARRTTGERAPGYASVITETRHWAFAEVTENHPLDEDPDSMLGNRSSLLLSNTDNGRTGWWAYGPRELAVGTRVELFEYKVYGKWDADFRVLPDIEG